MLSGIWFLYFVVALISIVVAYIWHFIEYISRVFRSSKDWVAMMIEKIPGDIRRENTIINDTDSYILATHLFVLDGFEWTCKVVFHYSGMNHLWYITFYVYNGDRIELLHGKLYYPNDYNSDEEEDENYDDNECSTKLYLKLIGVSLLAMSENKIYLTSCIAMIQFLSKYIIGYDSELEIVNAALSSFPFELLDLSHKQKFVFQ